MKLKYGFHGIMVINNLKSATHYSSYLQKGFTFAAFKKTSYAFIREY